MPLSALLSKDFTRAHIIAFRKKKKKLKLQLKCPCSLLPERPKTIRRHDYEYNINYILTIYSLLGDMK